MLRRISTTVRVSAQNFRLRLKTTAIRFNSSSTQTLSTATKVVDDEETLKKLFAALDPSQPDQAWNQLAPVLKAEELIVPDVVPPRKPNHIRFVCISDTHSWHEKLQLPEGDVLIHAGDFTDRGSYRDVARFNEWLGLQTGFKHKIVIAGNHDLTFEPATLEDTSYKWGLITTVPEAGMASLLTNCTYLEDTSVTVAGYQIHGSPWTPRFHDWAFNADRGAAIDRYWQKIPTETDILISHGPALGFGDWCNRRTGCLDLLAHIMCRVKPLYHISGHIHEGWGLFWNGKTHFINASSASESFTPDDLNPPIVFDLPVRVRSNAS